MTKIEALEKTIFNLENDVYEYEWSHSNTCNCGVLARTLLNGEKATEGGGLWMYHTKGLGFSGVVKNVITHCQQTGLPIPIVVKSLLDAGFTTKELSRLEYRANGEGRSDKKELVSYLKRWVRKIEKLNKEPEVQECDATMPNSTTEVCYKNISKELAVLPMDEVSDLKKEKIVL